ncbi:MAG: NTP transferase domain-containing protein [Candidatus Buchananbacteria bacterium]|nr:NTP transferase domain-containing protein [Candidatus Buchananbacteria bacterium]
MNKFQVIVLAGGLGKRMNSHDIPKALVPLHGRPMISYLLDAIKEADVCARPLIVVGKLADKVKSALGPDYDYAFQAEQLGTGHAVMVSREQLQGSAENILVLYCDHPLVSPQTIKNILDTHVREQEVLTMATTVVPDFEGWRLPFYDFGRVVRSDSGKIIGIVEKKDAAPEQLQIKEVNPSYFCFKADWLWTNLDLVRNHNTQQEYYLTDLVDIAFGQNHQIASVQIEPKEAMGINSQEQLDLISKLL